jgi:hypothetical protein
VGERRDHPATAAIADAAFEIGTLLHGNPAPERFVFGLGLCRCIVTGDSQFAVSSETV